MFGGGMGAQLLTLAGVGLVVGFLVWFLARASRQQGRAEGMIKAADKHNKAINEQNEKVAEENRQIVEEVEKTHEVHDRLERDPAYRKRVRDRFTRPD